MVQGADHAVPAASYSVVHALSQDATLRVATVVPFLWQVRSHTTGWKARHPVEGGLIEIIIIQIPVTSSCVEQCVINTA